MCELYGAVIEGDKERSGRSEPKVLRDWLGEIWDAVSRELDCRALTKVEQKELGRLESHLAQSVDVLRPIVG